MSDLFGPGGQQLLAGAALAVESWSRVDSLLPVITALDFEIDTFARLVAGRLRADPGYVAIQSSQGWGRCWARCSSPRSATSPASPVRSSWPRGPG